MNTGQERKILVTGVRSGIGNAIALAAMEAGYHVWGTGREINSLPDAGGLFHPVELDLLNAESVELAAATVEREAGRLHAIVHNAGAGVFGPVDELEPTELETQFALLCHAPWRLTQLLLETLEPGSGRVIFITSLAARLPIPGMGPYNAAKAALGSLVDTVRIEPMGRKIHWVEVQPGDIRTAFNEHAAAVAPKDAARRAAFHELWEQLEHHLHAAPEPDCVARCVLRQLAAAHPARRVTAGDFFQTRLAPLGWRFFPKAWMESLLRAYYKIQGPQ